MKLHSSYRASVQDGGSSRNLALAEDQVVVMAKIALAQLPSAYQFCSFFDLDVLFTVIHVLVTSFLD